jgi:hypothetical protein
MIIPDKYGTLWPSASVAALQWATLQDWVMSLVARVISPAPLHFYERPVIFT